MRHWEDLAWRVQDDTENVLLARARWLRETTGAKNLTLAVLALNCVANGRVARETGFDNVWIQPAAGDDGIAIGCAYYGWLEILKQRRGFVMDHSTSASPIPRRTSRPNCRNFWCVSRSRPSAARMCRDTAKLLADQRVIGWFQDGSEFGPRALGNRSLIADPRKPEMKDILNSRVKHSPGVPPFAPIVLAERMKEIFEGDHDLPFMLIAKPVRPEWRQDSGDRACRRHRARPDRARSDQSDAVPVAEGVRGADRRSRADQHLIQHQGRADRGNAAGCGELAS